MSIQGDDRKGGPGSVFKSFRHNKVGTRTKHVVVLTSTTIRLSEVPERTHPLKAEGVP